VLYNDYVVRELESGTIEVQRAGLSVGPVLPVLKVLALELNVPLLNSAGNPLNTRQLGSQVIRTISEMQSPQKPAVAHGDETDASYLDPARSTAANNAGVDRAGRDDAGDALGR